MASYTAYKVCVRIQQKIISCGQLWLHYNTHLPQWANRIYTLQQE